MTASLPFLTAYDPPGSSEGNLDPMGLYQVADQLATLLVPGVRERMQRIRFLTAIAVGALVTEGIEDDPAKRDASPYLVWEWLLVEAFIRAIGHDPALWGSPGTLVSRRAIDQYGYLDARSYLKSPRIFGFFGVYKRLALRLGIVNVHLGPGPKAEELVAAWAHSRGLVGLSGARQQLSIWKAAVVRSISERPPRTKPGWDANAWATLADSFAPGGCKGRERRCLRELLHAGGERHLGALRDFWALQADIGGDGTSEEESHDLLQERFSSYRPLIGAIRAYERFARGLQDGFDVLRAEATPHDSRGFSIPAIGRDADFVKSVDALHERFAASHAALSELGGPGLALAGIFAERFQAFADPMDAVTAAKVLCSHHETVQRMKSVEGKRAWFDRIGPDCIYIRHGYRETRRGILPGAYVHGYRYRPIRRFYGDLT